MITKYKRKAQVEMGSELINIQLLHVDSSQVHTTLFMIPEMGKGSYTIPIIDYLLKNGLDLYSDIFCYKNGMILGYEVDPQLRYLLKTKLSEKYGIEMENIPIYENEYQMERAIMNQEFRDNITLLQIITNPSWHNPNNQKHKPYVKLIKNAPKYRDIINKQSNNEVKLKINLVIPDSPFYSRGGETKDARQVIYELGLEYLYRDTSGFFRVSCGSCMIIAGGGENNVKLDDGTYIDWDGSPSLISKNPEYDVMYDKVVELFENYDGEKLQGITINVSKKDGLADGTFSTTKSDTHSYEYMETASCRMWSRTKLGFEDLHRNKFGCEPQWLTICNMSGYFYNGIDTIDKYQVVTDSILPGRNVIGIPATTKECAMNNRSWLTSDLYVFVMCNEYIVGYSWNAVKLLKKLDSSKHWTNEMVYNEYNVTNDVREYVSDWVKKNVGKSEKKRKKSDNGSNSKTNG